MHATHENGIRTDNRPENLSWKTPAGNQADRWRHGTMCEGEKNTSAKLTDDDVREIRKLGHLTLKLIAEMYGVHLTTIHAVRTGRYWGHVS